jgi:hypothetical protein
MALLWKNAVSQPSAADEANAQLLVNEGGFSFSPYHGYAPKNSFVFSVHHGHYTPSTNELFDSVAEVTPERLAQHREIIDEHIRAPHWYQGAWHDPDTGKVHLDLSHATEDHRECYEQAKKHDQISYYDMGTGTTYYINPKSDPDCKTEAERDVKYSHLAEWGIDK